VKWNGLAPALLVVCLASSPAFAQTGTYQVTGRVLMETGSPVPDAAAVELTCNARMRARVRPFANGDFTINLDDENQNVADITAPRELSGSVPAPFTGFAKPSTAGEDIGRFDFSGCELRAALPGYQSNVITLGPRRRLDKSVVGNLVLHPISAPDGPVFTANTLAAPKTARSALMEAWKLLQNENPDHPRAARLLEGAIQEYRSFAAAWHLLGVVRLALKNESGAREALNESIAADPMYVEPYIELATIAARQQLWSDTAALIDRAQQINPDIAYVNYLSASAHFHLGNIDSAEKSALAVFNTSDLDRYPLIHYFLGAIAAQRGDFAKAAFRFEQFLQTKPDPAVAASVREVLADWKREGRLK
jgi:cytochrome c-type biogenesis protein CcmH/NrfG